MKDSLKVGKRVVSTGDLVPVVVLGAGLGISAAGLGLAIKHNDPQLKIIFGAATTICAVGTVLTLNSVQNESGKMVIEIIDGVEDLTHEHDLEVFQSSIRLLQEITSKKT